MELALKDQKVVFLALKEGHHTDPTVLIAWISLIVMTYTTNCYDHFNSYAGHNA